MNDITDKSRYPDLYLTLNPSHDTLHIKRSTEGRAGFRKFVLRNAEPYRDEPIAPDNWMFHYEFSDKQLARLPELSGLKSRDYFKTLYPALRREDILPATILPLNRALGLLNTDRSLFATCREALVTRLSSLLPAGHALDLVLPPFRAYNAVKTFQGVLLFTPTPDGSKRLEGFMQHLADSFYEPQMPHESIDIYQVPAFDASLAQYADLCPKVPGNPLGQNELLVPPEAFAPESVLREGMEMLHYDMAPTWENFNALTMPPYHSGLHASQRNYDISCLQRYADRGYTLPAQIEHDIYSFSYTKQFEELYRLVPAQWPSHENQVRLLANRILQRDFPDIRGGARQKAEEIQLHIPDMTPDTPQKSRALKPH